VSEIKIKHAVKLSGAMLFVVVESAANGKSDAILLVMPSEDALIPSYIESLEETLSLPVDIQSGKDKAEITFEIDAKLFDRTSEWCTEVGISIEQLALAFIRFCACTDNHTALKKWFSPSRIVAELNSAIEELHCVQAELLEIKQRFGIDKQEAFLEM